MPPEAGRRPSRVSPLFLAFLPVAVLVTGPSQAAIIDVPADQPTVRAAVEAAASGDTVLVAPGVHAGGVYVNGKAVTLASRFLTTGDTSYVAQTVIDSIVGDPCGGHSGCAGNAVIEFASDAHGSAVIGLTVTHGEDGVRSHSTVDILGCRILGNADGLDFQDGGGGTFRNNLIANNSDDGIDLNGRIDATIRDNVVRDNHQDGVEFRLYTYTGPVARTDFIGNRFTGNGGDGIQLIDYPDASDRVVRIEHNFFGNNGDAAVGCMPNGQTSEDFSGAPIAERVYLIGNTFSGARYGFVGGANVIALNNIFSGTQVSALRRMGGNSIASYTLFWNNAIDFEESVVDAAHALYADPLLAAGGELSAGSPAIDAGTAFFQWQGETVLDLPPAGYLGGAPDLGAFEFDTGAPPPPNSAPQVSAGPDQAIALPAEAVLDGTVTDDGLPFPSTLATTWSVASGPGPVTFQNAGAVDTRATFTTAGSYVLLLTANDGALGAADAVQITVQPAPSAIERRIAVGGDDAEESATGSVSAKGSDLELVYDRNLQTVGLRFTNLTIPRGATIARAWLQFEADERHSEATSLVLRAQAADNPPGFTSTTASVSSRPRTAASASWQPPAWTLVGEAGTGQRTPELKAVIQEIVNRPGWVSGNALAIIITGSGHRTARAFEGRAAGAALLHLELGSGGPPAENTAPAVDAGPGQSIALPAEAVLDGTVFDDGLPSPPGSLVTVWSVASGPGPVTVVDAGAVDTRATFTTTGTYVLRLTASDGALSASDSVQITVQAPVSGFEQRVAVGGDDAEEGATGTMDLGSSDLELVFDKTIQQVGMRFTNVTIPRGAVVIRAYVQFEADEAQNEVTSLVIQGQAADDPAGFTSSAGNISTRPRTAASVPWSPPAWTLVGEAGANQRTPELAAVIQEVVNRPGWASGNALVIVMSGTGHRTARAFEGRAAGAALLHIELGVAAQAVAEDASRAEDRASPLALPRVVALHQASPNPSHGALRVAFSLADARPATLEVLDVAGRRAVSREVGSLGPGRHEIDLRERLPAGVYFLRLRQGSVARMLKAVVIE